MSEFAKMDIFFFVTTLVVVVLGVIFAFILFRVWKILGRVEHVAQEVESEAQLLRGDIAQMRSAGHFGMKQFWRFLKRMFLRFADDSRTDTKI
ncbi:MAG TPA: hypothetical protein VMU25_01360 [Candidatus Paceibacterota bacterium]|nr:hypothetical protein [Candidatus Paceibacterota bacterium]